MLEGFSFVDCMLIDMAVSPDLSSLQVVTEVQIESTDGKPARMGHARVRLTQVEDLEIKILPGFHADIDYAYEYKGNEIYEFSFDAMPDDQLVVTLRSDLLFFRATCPRDGCKSYLLS